MAKNAVRAPSVTCIFRFFFLGEIYFFNQKLDFPLTIVNVKQTIWKAKILRLEFWLDLLGRPSGHLTYVPWILPKKKLERLGGISPIRGWSPNGPGFVQQASVSCPHLLHIYLFYSQYCPQMSLNGPKCSRDELLRSVSTINPDYYFKWKLLAVEACKSLFGIVSNRRTTHY